MEFSFSIFLRLGREEMILILFIILVKSMTQFIPRPYEGLAYILDFVFDDIFPLVVIGRGALDSRSDSAHLGGVRKFAMTHV